MVAECGRDLAVPPLLVVASASLGALRERRDSQTRCGTGWV